MPIYRFLKVEKNINFVEKYRKFFSGALINTNSRLFMSVPNSQTPENGLNVTDHDKGENEISSVFDEKIVLSPYHVCTITINPNDEYQKKVNKIVTIRNGIKEITKKKWKSGHQRLASFDKYWAQKIKKHFNGFKYFLCTEISEPYYKRGRVSCRLHFHGLVYTDDPYEIIEYMTFHHESLIKVADVIIKPVVDVKKWEEYLNKQRFLKLNEYSNQPSTRLGLKKLIEKHLGEELIDEPPSRKRSSKNK